MSAATPTLPNTAKTIAPAAASLAILASGWYWGETRSTVASTAVFTASKARIKLQMRMSISHSPRAISNHQPAPKTTAIAVNSIQALGWVRSVWTTPASAARKLCQRLARKGRSRPANVATVVAGEILERTLGMVSFTKIVALRETGVAKEGENLLLLRPHGCFFLRRAMIIAKQMQHAMHGKQA